MHTVCLGATAVCRRHHRTGRDVPRVGSSRQGAVVAQVRCAIHCAVLLNCESLSVANFLVLMCPCCASPFKLNSQARLAISELDVSQTSSSLSLSLPPALSSPCSNHMHHNPLRVHHHTGPSNISTVVPNVLVIGDSVSEGYTPFLRAALGAPANVQHGPDNTGGGSADGSHYGELCTPYFIRTPLHTLPSWRVITYVAPSCLVLLLFVSRHVVVLLAESSNTAQPQPRSLAHSLNHAQI